MLMTITGWKPSSGIHAQNRKVPVKLPVQVWRRAVARLYLREEWWITCEAQKKRTLWLTR